MVKELKIVLDPSPTNGYFLAGSPITGKVVVRTGSSKSYYSKVEVILVGRINSNFSDSVNNLQCSYNQEILRSSVVVWERSTVKKKFKKGVSHLTFTIDIPSEDKILPSCKNNHTEVEYTIGAIISKDKRGKTDSSHLTTIKIFPRVDVGITDLQKPQSFSSSNSFSGWCCFSSGGINLDVLLERKGYIISENVKIQVEIDNTSSKKVSHFDAALMQKIKCGGTAKQSMIALLYAVETSVVGERVSGQPVLPRSSWGETLHIPIPNTPPTTCSSQHEPILKVEYYLLIRVHISHDADKVISLQCPLILGTYKNEFVNETPNDHHPQNQSSVSDSSENPPPYSESPCVPTAPSLPRNSLINPMNS